MLSEDQRKRLVEVARQSVRAGVCGDAPPDVGTDDPDLSQVQGAFVTEDEVAARSTMLLTLLFGRPAERTSSSVPFVAALRGLRRPFGITLALVAPLPFLLPFGIALVPAVLCIPVATIAGLAVSNRLFGGISGDTTGAAGELTRTIILIILSTTA